MTAQELKMVFTLKSLQLGGTHPTDQRRAPTRTSSTPQTREAGAGATRAANSGNLCRCRSPWPARTGAMIPDSPTTQMSTSGSANQKKLRKSISRATHARAAIREPLKAGRASGELY